MYIAFNFTKLFVLVLEWLPCYTQFLRLGNHMIFINPDTTASNL